MLNSLHLQESKDEDIHSNYPDHDFSSNTSSKRHDLIIRYLIKRMCLITIRTLTVTWGKNRQITCEECPSLLFVLLEQVVAPTNHYVFRKPS